METFTIRDLREHTGALVHDAEAGKLSLITKHGRPVFLAVPFDEALLTLGLRPALAIKLYQADVLTLEKAAKLADLSLEALIEKLGQLGIATVDYSKIELDAELDN